MTELKNVKKIRTDILIVGSGAAGLYCALKLPKEKQIVIITKEDAESSDSFLAQGGMCVLRIRCGSAIIKTEKNRWIF